MGWIPRSTLSRDLDVVLETLTDRIGAGKNGEMVGANCAKVEVCNPPSHPCGFNLDENLGEGFSS